MRYCGKGGRYSKKWEGGRYSKKCGIVGREGDIRRNAVLCNSDIHHHVTGQISKNQHKLTKLENGGPWGSKKETWQID